MNNADVTSVRKDEDVAGTQQVSPTSTFDARASISKQETAPNVAESSPPTVEGNDAVIHTDSNTKAPPTSPTRQPPVNIGDTNLNKSARGSCPFEHETMVDFRILVQEHQHQEERTERHGRAR